ncbi:alpha/beta fold hydrolase [Stenotrophomonas lactitubi]|uniref:alpha/beta fold hydrolase n=1 Tax=Stenotrophomonas lactitubi TaxID=2045214 RepID=UPI003875E41B
MANTFHRVGHGSHPVLVLHGWFGDAHAFAPIEPWLSRDDFSYLFMDCRGYGGMRDAPGAYTIDEIASDALDLMTSLGHERFSVAGHSMGGMAIERMAVLAPERIRGMVAIAPVPCGGIAYDAATRGLLEAASGDVSIRRAIIDRSTGGRLPAQWLDWKAAYSVAHASPAAFAAYLPAWADTDFSNEIVGTHRLKVLVGGYDPTFNRALMERTYLRRYRQATMEVLQDAGHYPMNETPLALVAAMESFLKEASGPK